MAIGEELSLDKVEPYVPGQVQTAEGYIAPETYDPGKSGTVAGQMEGILSSGSPYIEAARTRGKEYATKRGLLNSSIAAGATEKAAIESALPIAQQDASTFSKAGLSAQEFGQESSLVDVKAGASSQLSAQEAAQVKDIDIQQQEGADRRLQAELASSEKGKVGGNIAALSENFQAQVAGIQVDDSLTPSAKRDAIKSLRTIHEANIKSIGSIYDVQIDWEV